MLIPINQLIEAIPRDDFAVNQVIDYFYLQLTGYLGGAVAGYVRVDNPLLSHVLFPVYIALLVWGGLYLRDRRLRGLLPAQLGTTGNSNSPRRRRGSTQRR
jgi:hypothetical protein